MFSQFLDVRIDAVNRRESLVRKNRLEEIKTIGKTIAFFITLDGPFCSLLIMSKSKLQKINNLHLVR